MRAISLKWIRSEVSHLYPQRPILEISPIPRGLAFEVVRIDLQDGEQLIFKGQKNRTIPYEGYQNYACYLRAEISFFELLANSDVPVPKIYHSELDDGENGLSCVIMECMSGQPLDSLMPSLSADELRSFHRIMGETLARIHAIEPSYIWRPDDRRKRSWNEYFTDRLTRRLEPHLQAGLFNTNEMDLFLSLSSSLPNPTGRLLHMDFRYENLLGTITGCEASINGVIDGANSLAGDVVYEFARMSGGKPVNPDLLEAYQAVRGPIELDTLAYRLYELETAALLAGHFDQKWAIARFQQAKVKLLRTP